MSVLGPNGPRLLAQKCSTFEVRRRTGETFTVIIDAEDEQRVREQGTWNLDARGYVVRARKGQKPLKLHRFLLDCKTGDPMVDHRNGDKLDCRKGNLRMANALINGANLDPVNNRGRSKYRGVTWHAASGRWRASQRVNRRYRSLGLFDTEEAAAEALRAFRTEHGLGER